MQEAAQNLGMEFQIKDEYGHIGMMRDFKLFKRGYGKTIRNIISVKRDLEKADFRVFDYHYIIGAGNTTRKISQTVFYVHSKELNLPELFMKPEHFFHQIGEFFGMQDINFEAFPVFSKQYLVQGPEEGMIREALSDNFLHYFTIEKKWALEGLNYMLIFYKHGKRVPAEDIEYFYENGLKVFELLKNKK